MSSAPFEVLTARSNWQLRASRLGKDHPAEFAEPTKEAPLRQVLQTLRSTTPAGPTPRDPDLGTFR